MEVNGFWFPAGSSNRQPARLILSGKKYVLRIGDSTSGEGSFSALKISRRVGNIPRKITFNNQSVFETTDNESIDEWIRLLPGKYQAGWAHRLESRWHWIALAMMAVVVFMFAASRWGLPWVSQVIARNVPDVIVERISSGSLELLDDWILQPSELSEQKKRKLIERFSQNLSSEDGGYTLRFRKLGMPNALALPSGDLIITDRFALLATLEEFDAVMLHEIGHVRMRHGLQQLVRSSIVTFIVAMIAGEPSGLEEVIIALPVFLLQSHYSRAHEAEADDFALNAMIERNIDPIHFARIMQKLEDFHTEEPGTDKKESGGSAANITDYLSSHPA
ncbi:MAG: M48 family metallopeptidase, partial [bacterium]